MKIYILNTMCLISLALSGKGIYYDELKQFQSSSIGKIIFDAEDNNGLVITQMDIDSYQSCDNTEVNNWLSEAKDNQHLCSLSFINRSLLASKNLSLLEEILQWGFSSLDPIIISCDTLSYLANYIDHISKKLHLSQTPIALLAQQEGFGICSRKILFFKGTLIIGQDLLHDLSDEELEALIVRELVAIKYNHSNKKYALNGIIMFGLYNLAKNFVTEYTNNTWLNYVIVPALTKAMLNKRFERQVDSISSGMEKGAGLIDFYERLEKKIRKRNSSFEKTYRFLQKNKHNISFLAYLRIITLYYCATTEHKLVGIYNSITYNTPAQRIELLTK